MASAEPAQRCLDATSEELALQAWIDKFSNITNLVRRPRPVAGRNHKIWVWLAGKRYRAVKDTGA